MICLSINLNHISSRFFLWFFGLLQVALLTIEDFWFWTIKRYDSLNTGRNRCFILCFIWLQKLPAWVLLYAWWVVAFCTRTHFPHSYVEVWGLSCRFDKLCPKKNLLHMICIDLLSNVLVHPCWHWWMIGSGVLNSLHSCHLVSSMYVAESCKWTVYGVLVLVFKLAHVILFPVLHHKGQELKANRHDSTDWSCTSDSCKRRHLEFCNTHMLHSQTATNHIVGQYMIFRQISSNISNT